MRRPLLVLTVVAVVALGLAVPTAAVRALDGQLPWRGALTRRLYLELARGAVPTLACAPRRSDDLVDPATPRVAMRAERICRGAMDDSSYVVDVDMADGWVYAVRREWRMDSARATALADSIARALAAERRRAFPCMTRTGGGGASRADWAATDDRPYRAELHVRRERDRWSVALVRRHTNQPVCSEDA